MMSIDSETRREELIRLVAFHLGRALTLVRQPSDSATLVISAMTVERELCAAEDLAHDLTPYSLELWPRARRLVYATRDVCVAALHARLLALVLHDASAPDVSAQRAPWEAPALRKLDADDLERRGIVPRGQGAA